MRHLKTLSLALGMFVASNASAGWILVDDSGAINGATNPGPANVSPAGPDNQSPAAVKDWLDNVINGDSGSLLMEGDSTPDVLTGLDALGAVYIVLHYGNYQEGDLALSGNINIAYTCSSDCDSFNPVNKGLSGYRVYGVPEPGTMALLSIGLLGLAFGRRYRRN